MNYRHDTSLWMRLAGMAILGLFIALAAAAYFSGQQVKRSSELITTDAVPGTIDAHKMRMAMSRSIGWVMVAASAQTAQSRDESLKTAHDADVAFADAVKDYETTIKINPPKDRALLNEVTSQFEEYHRKMAAYEALILAGNRDGAAAYLERDLVPAYVVAIRSAEDLLDYNHANTITYADSIRDSVHRLYWTAAVVIGLALACAAVLFVHFSIRREEVRKLRESEEKFSKAFQSNPSGIAITEIETGKYLEANESFCRFLGRSPQELIGQTTIETGIWSSAEERNKAFQSLLAGNTLRNLELQVHAGDGASKTVLINAELIELGGKRCVVTLAQDITERKRAEQAVRASESALKEAQHLAHVGSSVWDSRTDKTTWSDEMYRIVGWDPSRPAPTHAQRAEIYTPESYAILDRAVKRALATGEPYDLQLEIVRPDGERRHVNARGSCVRDESGAVIGLNGALQDITERIKAEEALRDKQAQLLFAMDIAKLAHWEFDLEENLLTGDEHIFQLLGTTSEKEGGLSMSPETYIRKFVHPADAGLVANEVALGVSTTDPNFARQFEHRVIRADKTEGVMMVRSRIVMSAAGRPVKIHGTNQDITESRKLEAQFRQSQKMESIGQLAGGVAHDFNNILAVISMQAGLLGNDGGLTSEQSELLREMDGAVQRAADLTRQLLLFSRRQTMQPRDLDLNTVVNNMSKMLRRILGEDIENTFNYAPGPLYVNADAGMMDQVLMNLTVNARDAMPEGGRLVIETSSVELDELAASQVAQARAGAFACLSVSDTGCGIPPENMQRIFEPFFTTKDVGKGTGLGLATVFGIVQQHQGWINIYSEVGHGTRFRIYLPLVARGDQKESAKQVPASTFGGKETILMVEDDPALRNSVRTAISHLGYRVLEASTGPGALEAWAQNRDEIRLLLTDLMLPGGMNGKQLARRLLEERPALKVLYTSGYSTEVAGKDLILEEGVNFLAKPFNAQKLAQSIRAKLDS